MMQNRNYFHKKIFKCLKQIGKGHLYLSLYGCIVHSNSQVSGHFINKTIKYEDLNLIYIYKRFFIYRPNSFLLTVNNMNDCDY